MDESRALAVLSVRQNCPVSPNASRRSGLGPAEANGTGGGSPVLTRRSMLLLVPAGLVTATTASLASRLATPVATASQAAFDEAGRIARRAFPTPNEDEGTASRQALSRAVTAAMGGRSDVIGVSVLDRRTSAWWHYRGDALVRTGSVAKTLVVAAALRKARAQGGALTARQRDQARLAITRSDNASADALYGWIGRHAGVAALASDLGMADTAGAKAAGHWGHTLTSPNDLVRMMTAFTSGNRATHPDDDAYLLELMSAVVDGQRWGVGTVGSGSVDVHVKNGWMLVDNPWVINSVGDVVGAGRDYELALMQRAQPDQDSGIRRASRIGRAVFDALKEPLL